MKNRPTGLSMMKVSQQQRIALVKKIKSTLKKQGNLDGWQITATPKDVSSKG